MMGKAPWMQTASGLRFDLLDPRPEQVSAEDIAHHLSRIARFLGATWTDLPWDVASHSLLVEWLLPDDASHQLRLLALLHDAHEAYTGDMILPMKWALAAQAERLPAQAITALDAFRMIQWRVQAVIHARFALPATITPEEAQAIREADRKALALEAAQLMAPAPEPWADLVDPPAGFVLEPQPCAFAKNEFLVRLFGLLGERDGRGILTAAPAPLTPD